jgi:hypothetical protein
MVSTSHWSKHESPFGASVNDLRRRGWTWTGGVAAFGLCGGIVSGLIGSALTAMSWLTGPLWHNLHLQRTGTILLALTIPLLILGGHCLDLIDKENKKNQ